ncbi:tyrosyl-DNA phosphodiesterase 1 isoform X3 [Alosa sapidissima]|uniref:tyrosyl-DNA phosphodiesterase 1 isoform X3 n=1 Tax=Alosa sapidissima TaxID=34773 RepID=UPI001C08A51D|nr:tyrosyl-DNA phosphodiesterase 1 isoform X3 [Alosa sapidissima]
MSIVLHVKVKVHTFPSLLLETHYSRRQKMSQQSAHGRWTVSSSDDDDDVPPHSSNIKTERVETSEQDTIKTEPVTRKIACVFQSNTDTPDVKSEPSLAVKKEPKPSALVMGSEARQTAQANQQQPVKYENNNLSPAVKRKRETEEAGWALSSSDDDNDNNPKDRVIPSGQKIQPKTQSSPKRVKKEVARPPSPHGRTYYIDEPADYFETSINEEAETYRFYLNKVVGLDKKYNTGAIHIREILSPMFGTLKESVQFNYCFDIPWMVEQYPPEFRDKPVLIVHGEKRESKARLIQQAQPYAHVRFCQAKLDIAFGTHHTKMMLLWYVEGFRVVILTSNMIRADWYQKTQGMWISPLYPVLPEGRPETAGESPTFFKRDLIEYLQAYRAPELSEWIQRIREHDLSDTSVYLIGSTPGRYVGADMEKWGHLRLRKLLREHTKPVPNEEAWPVIGQFSSIGSMGLDKTKWLAAEFQRTLTTLGKGGKSVGPEPQMLLVYPSVDNVRTSLEGYPAGGSLPYSIQTAQRQLWLHSYFQLSVCVCVCVCVCVSRWGAETTGRSHAMPHIKTYMRVSPDFTQLAWFLVTSSNLSKAAWGGLEKNNTQVMVRSYELGVLFLPSAFNLSTFRVQKNVFPADEGSSGFPVPFDLPPQRYSSKDQPWIWNIPYTQSPDTHGNVWVPS